MKPKIHSKTLLGITQSKAKMYEYAVPTEDHIRLKQDPSALLRLTIGILGDYAVLDVTPDKSSDKSDELRRTLFFSAQFFDSYINSRLVSELNSYLLLLGAASYYLCDFPGSSQVLLKKIDPEIDAECDGLDKLLLTLLNNQYKKETAVESKFKESITGIYTSLVKFRITGDGAEEIENVASKLKRLAYLAGSPRELLIADIICAVIRKRIHNSSWKALTRYTGISRDRWRPTIEKESFIKEFWPAQILLGEKGVFSGRSAVVQMPTSAGKTKSIEIIIRSAFLSERSRMAVIVAPFKALCTEIKLTLEHAFTGENIDIDTPSDTFQTDFSDLEEADLDAKKLVLIATPEKLMYILRHSPELAGKVGLLVFDEGHQFDSGLRGVTYELLLSSLKLMIKQEHQTVLISAVISNSEIIGGWLNGDEGEVVSGINLSPTYRTVAFASWTDLRGRLQFVQPLDPDQLEYFVPRVIESVPLQKKAKERKEHTFPEKKDGKSIALYLGVKLVGNGAVAVFSGNKASVSSMCEKIVDIYDRNYNIPSPRHFSEQLELEKLRYLHEQHFGANYTTTKSAALGVFAHSANVPQGLRLAIEYAMQMGTIKFVICTSTLAQGVNLPIKYLIVTSVQQGRERIKTRDFHNLIGRAGRAGMHTEGSILFADPEVYDRRFATTESWRWANVKTLIDPKNSEPCASTLSTLFDPLTSDDDRYIIRIDALDFVRTYLENTTEIELLPQNYAARFASANFSRSNLASQIQFKIKIIGAIESYLMSYLEGGEVGEKDASNLAKGTLAYHLSDEQKKDELVKIFLLLANNVTIQFDQPVKRKVYGKTLFGVKDLLEIEQWVQQNLPALLHSMNSEELLDSLWPLLRRKIASGSFQKIVPSVVLLPLTKNWISGLTYTDIHQALTGTNAALIAGTQQRRIKQDVVVDICDNALSYDATLLIASIVEVVSLQLVEGKELLIDRLNVLQKQLKYGLHSPVAISFYESGFQDRVIANELASTFPNFGIRRRELLKDILRSEPELRQLLIKYPAYYTNVLDNLVRQ